MLNHQNFKVWILILCGVNYFGCSKSIYKNDEISGLVIDARSKNPVKNAFVVLFEKNTENLVSSSKRIDEIITNPNGNFLFSVPSTKNAKYEINVFHKSYFEDSNSWKVIDNSEKNILFSLTPKAYLKLKVENQTPFDENDRILLSLVFGYTIPPWEGMSILDSLVGEVNGNQKTTIYYWVRKNNFELKDSLIIIPIPFDTLTVNINY